MTDYYWYLVGGLSLLPFVVVQVIWHFTPQAKKDEMLRKSFVERELPKIYAKASFDKSIWTAQVFCPQDHSRCYQKSVDWFEFTPGVRRNFAWFCPVCGRRMDFAS